MYSLYRAWFGATNTPPSLAEESSTTAASYPRLMDTLSPPDTVIRVGNDDEYHFVAHRAVLSAHSGYLKALLAATASSASSDSDALTQQNARNADGTQQPIVTSITVPSTIGGEAFAPLLNYMYTGRLEVTLDNIYTVLLATHLLHMPGALEQCRAALLRLRAPPILPPAPTASALTINHHPSMSTTPPPVIPPSLATTTTSSSSSSAAAVLNPTSNNPTTNVLRPVPNRLLSPAFCWAAAAQNAAAAAAVASHLYGTAAAPRSHHLDLAQHLGTTSALQLTNSPVLGLSGLVSSAGSVLQSHSQLMSRASLGFGKERSLSPSSTTSQPPHRAASCNDTHSGSASPELVVVSSVSSVTQRSSASSDDQQNHTSSQQRHPSPALSVDNDDETKDKYKEQSTKHAQQQQQQQQQSKRRKLTSSGTSSQQRQQQKDGKLGRSSQADRSSSNSSATIANGAQTPGVVFDVACCDGPVRFHRVLNENYAPPQPTAQLTPSNQQNRILLPHCNGRSSTSNNSNNSNNSSHQHHHHRENSNDSTTSFNNHHNSHHHHHHNHHHSENDENDHQQNSASSDSNRNNYSCGYCHHTFKSQYCYRKHARRHLLPTDSNSGNENSNNERRSVVAPSVESNNNVSVTAGSGSGSGSVSASVNVNNNNNNSSTGNNSGGGGGGGGKKREVRLLDLNVQYYPCKICGSKFPSYYFVHKHRKLCHANVDEQQQQQSNTSNATSGRNVDDATASVKSLKEKHDEQQASTSENVAIAEQQVG